MADTPNGQGYPYNFDQRMTRMEAHLNALTDAFQKYHVAVMEEMRTMREMYREQHVQSMEEIRELITLQREHRIDIMALFEVGKDHRKRIENLESGTHD
jgi:DNA repair ATPase RecN